MERWLSRILSLKEDKVMLSSAVYQHAVEETRQLCNFFWKKKEGQC